MLIESMEGSCVYVERNELTAHSLWRAVWHRAKKISPLNDGLWNF